MIAKGSLAEVETFLLFSKDLGYITDAEYLKIDEVRKEVGRTLAGLIKSLR